MVAALLEAWSPKAWRRLHGCLAVGWAVMIPVSAFTGLRHSLPFLVGLSVYALAVGHFSAWQASRVEVQADNADG